MVRSPSGERKTAIRQSSKRAPKRALLSVVVDVVKRMFENGVCFC